jgi:hypothetical protein
MALPDKLFGEPRHDALCSTVELGRYGFGQGGNLGDPHGGFWTWFDGLSLRSKRSRTSRSIPLMVHVYSLSIYSMWLRPE